MAKAFDPYRMWLGIPVAEQPPTHYRLLGVSPDERQVDVIEAAVVRQSAYVRNFQSGQYADDAARILNEVAAAGICLTDPERRAEYDSELKATAARSARKTDTPAKSARATPRRPTPAAAAQRAAGPTAFLEDIPPPPAASVARGRSPLALGKRASWEQEPSPAWHVPVAIAGVVAILVLVVIYIRSGHNADLAELPESPAIESDVGPPNLPATPSPALVPPAFKTPDSTQSKPAAGPLSSAPKPAANGTSEAAVDAPKGPNEKPDQITKEENPAAPTSDRSEDVLASVDKPPGIDPQRDGPQKSGPVPLEPRVAKVAKRLPRPTGATLGTARKQVDTDFGKSFKKDATLPQRLAAVRAIYDASRAAADKPALQYALLEEARDRATNLGDAATACQAVEDLGRLFDVDLLALKAAALKGVLDKARVPQQLSTAAMLALLMSPHAAHADRFDVAEQFVNIASAAARKTSDVGLLKAADDRSGSLRTLKQDYQAFQDAQKKLKASAGDAKANYVAGRYHCYVHSDWERGLPLLAKGNDRDLAKLAAMELEVPIDRPRASALADAWLEATQSQRGNKQIFFLQQSRYWSHRAGKPAAKSDLPIRLAKADHVSLTRLNCGLAAELFEGIGFKQARKKDWTDWQVDFNSAILGTELALSARYSIRWTGWLLPPVPGKYMVSIASDETVRLRIDGSVIVDRKQSPVAVFDQSPATQSHKVELSEGPHELVVELEGAQVGAVVTLRWSFKDSTEHVVPAEALFFDAGR
jgi:hypothetical protein